MKKYACYINDITNNQKILGGVGRLQSLLSRFGFCNNNIIKSKALSDLFFKNVKKKANNNKNTNMNTNNNTSINKYLDIKINYLQQHQQTTIPIKKNLFYFYEFQLLEYLDQYYITPTIFNDTTILLNISKIINDIFLNFELQIPSTIPSYRLVISLKRLFLILTENNSTQYSSNFFYHKIPIIIDILQIYSYLKIKDLEILNFSESLFSNDNLLTSNNIPKIIHSFHISNYKTNDKKFSYFIINYVVNNISKFNFMDLSTCLHDMSQYKYKSMPHWKFLEFYVLSTIFVLDHYICYFAWSLLDFVNSFVVFC